MVHARQGPTAHAFGYDDLLRLKRDCTYDYFHGSRFPGQTIGNERCFVFKMSTKGPASGLDLVKAVWKWRSKTSVDTVRPHKTDTGLGHYG